MFIFCPNLGVKGRWNTWVWDNFTLREYSGIRTANYVNPAVLPKRTIRFQARSQNCEKRLLASSSLSVRPSVHMVQRDSYCAYIHEDWYLRVFGKYIEKLQVSLKSDKNNGYFAWRPTWIHSRIKNVSGKSCSEKQNTHFMFINFFRK